MPHEPIPPALTPEQWASWRARRGAGLDAVLDCVPHMTPAGLARTVAAANDARPAADPGKLTWATVDDIRAAARAVAAEVEVDAGGRPLAGEAAPAFRAFVKRLDRWADAIAALLPPRDAPPR